MILVALEFQTYFQLLYEDYDIALAWKRIITQIHEDGSLIDTTSEDYLTVAPLFPLLRDQADKLANLYIHSYIATSLTTVCSFRTIVNYIFAKLTDRPYKVTEVTKIDIFLIGYWIFFLIILAVYQQHKYVKEFYFDSGIIDKDDFMHRFAGAMLYEAEVKDFRYDYVTGIFATLNMGKVLLQFTFTGTFGPLLKMIQTMGG